MQEQRALPVRAAIDIGSNTVHLVVARCMPDNLEIVEDQVDIVRIGESVTASGEISAQKSAAAITVLRKYKELAEGHGAERIFVVATEAIRQASNGAAFLEEVRKATGLQVHLISGTAEATLTFYGATYTLYAGANPPAQVGVADVGGGSMELITAKHRQITWKTSLPIGSGWLHDRYLPSDPPTYDELSAARTFLRTYFEGVHLKRHPPVLTVTGGSANSLLRLVHRAFGLDESSDRLTRDDLVRCEGLLSALPAEEIARRYEQPIERARILLAGTLILLEVMTHLGLNEITISPHGIREGVLLAYERFGERWLECIDDKSQHGKEPEPQEETFLQSGQRMLLGRTKKLLEWTDEVLKQEDIEGVHKMRVASRRLRATLDAYESCYDSKHFKRIYRRVKQAADVLGAARDTDVLLQNVQANAEQVSEQEQAGVQWLIERLEAYRQERQQELETFLKSFDEGELEEQIESGIQKGGASNGKS